MAIIFKVKKVKKLRFKLKCISASFPLRVTGIVDLSRVLKHFGSFFNMFKRTPMQGGGGREGRRAAQKFR